MPDAGVASGVIFIDVTHFKGPGAGSLTEQTYTLDELRDVILRKSEGHKANLPWLKLARFGTFRTDKGSLRHDANVRCITGIEGDYDDEKMTPAEAVERLAKAGVLAMVYTSPSHTEDKPRWRVLCPLSEDRPPQDRAHLVGRLNGVLGGVLSAESFTLSQAYYYGSVLQNPSHMAEIVDGAPIDLCDELDEGWIGKPSTEDGGSGKFSKTDSAAILAQIVSGQSMHTATTRLLGVWASGGIPREEARDRLHSAFDAIPEDQRDERWHKRRGDIERCVADIYGKEAKKPAKRKARGGATGSSNPLAGYDLTQDGAALAFVDKHHEQLRFCHTAGAWMQWVGARWFRDETHVAFSWARDVLRDRAKGESDALRAQLGSAAAAAAVERFAQRDRRMAVTAATWDQDAMLLGTPGGTVDLRTGALRSARQEDYITKIASVSPAPTPDCPTWLRFLDEVTEGNDDLQEHLQRFAGYSLTGSTHEQKLLFIHGDGENGKSTFLRTIAGVMGDYAVTATMDAFMHTDFDRHSTDLAMMHGARMVWASETEDGRTWAETRIAQLTGGDTVTARFMRQDNFSFTPTFKLLFCGNHKPRLRNVNRAMRRRFNMVPFTTRPKVVDKLLPDKLREEWPGILRWMIDGCIAWQTSGLMIPDVVAQATEGYFNDEDVIGQWIEDCCIRDPDGWAPSAALFASWADYAKAQGQGIGDAKRFKGSLERLGIEAGSKRYGGRESQKVRSFKGLRLKPTLLKP